MKFKSVQKKTELTSQENARIKALREKFQKEKPGPEDCEGLMPLAAFVNVQILLRDLKKKRKAAALTLKDVAARTGMETAALSRLENGLQANPTTDTLQRYAGALGKQVVFGLADLPPAKSKPNRKGNAMKTKST